MIVSTYESPAWLEKVLIGFAGQSAPGFELVVADDGSGRETRELVEAMAPAFAGGLQHVWQRDDGFQKSRILNRAVLAARAPYLIFTDGDCVPRRDFVATHAARARAGCFLSGGCVKLPMTLSRLLGRDDIVSGRAFDARWLLARGLWDAHALAKIWPPARLARALDALTPVQPTWNGHNASGWKDDLLAVNGFDERMQYGGQDRELGERLVHAGIRPLQVRHSAIVLHLDHSRGYRTAESLARNGRIRAVTRARRATWTEFGIVKDGRRPAARERPIRVA